MAQKKMNTNVIDTVDNSLEARARRLAATQHIPNMRTSICGNKNRTIMDKMNADSKTIVDSKIQICK